MLNARRPCFFNFFSDDISAELLRIPQRFVEHMKGRTSGSVSLTGPSGNIWPVKLVQQDKDIVFAYGWPTFVEDHFVECGDLLVFRYDGDLCFTVQIFEISGCEKEAAFHSKYSQDPSQFFTSIGQKRGRDEEDESSDKSCRCFSKKLKGDLSFLPSEDKEKHVDAEGITTVKGFNQPELDASASDQEESSMQEMEQFWSPISSRLNYCNENSDLKTAAATLKRLSKEDQTHLARGHGPNISEKEKKVAKYFVSCFPYFVRIMKRFNISGSYTLNVPYQFSSVYFPSCKTEIILRTTKGACWSVNSVPTTRVHTSHTFCGGWMAFVRDNEIKMGDVCIFELLHKNDLRVFILRVGMLENQSEKVEQASVGCITTSNNLKSLSEKCGKNASNVNSRLILETYDRMGLNKSQVAASPNNMGKHGSASEGSGRNMTSSQSRVVTENQAAVRMTPSLNEQRAAKSFTSAFPNFVRIMRKFNISGSYTLKIPHKFCTTHLPNCKTEVILRNSKGGQWRVNSVPDSKGRRVHTFCGGWMAFVRENSLKIGDVCIFQLVSAYEMLVLISDFGSKALNSP